MIIMDLNAPSRDVSTKCLRIVRWINNKYPKNCRQKIKHFQEFFRLDYSPMHDGLWWALWSITSWKWLKLGWNAKSISVTSWISKSVFLPGFECLPVSWTYSSLPSQTWRQLETRNPSTSSRPSKRDSLKNFNTRSCMCTKICSLRVTWKMAGRQTSKKPQLKFSWRIWW